MKPKPTAIETYNFFYRYVYRPKGRSYEKYEMEIRTGIDGDSLSPMRPTAFRTQISLAAYCAVVAPEEEVKMKGGYWSKFKIFSTEEK